MNAGKLSDWFKKYAIENGLDSLRAKELAIEVVSISQSVTGGTVKIALSLIDTEDRSMMKWGSDIELCVGDTMSFFNLDHTLKGRSSGDALIIGLDDK